MERPGEERPDADATERLAGLGSWTHELPGGPSHRSENLYRLFEVPCGTGTEAILSRITATDRRRVRRAIQRLVTDGTPLEETFAIDLPDGTRRVLRAKGQRDRRDGTGTEQAVGVVQDVTERKRAEQAQAAAEERFRIAFEEAATPMSLISLEDEDRGRIIQANAAYAVLLGRELDEIVGNRVTTWTHPDDLDSGFDVPLRQLSSGEVQRVQFERRYLHADGHVVWTLVTEALYRHPDGRRLAIAQLLDISDRKFFEGQLRHLADHDPLTGLYNRRRFGDELERALAHTRRFGRPGAVLTLDIDGFKFVNDSLGHAVGDELVTRLAGVLRRGLRETDVVARTGGDEFAVILPETNRTAALAVADKLLADVRQSGTFVRANRHAQVTTSIGIALFGGTEDVIADDVLAEADIALYDAKSAGKDTARVYARDERRRERIAARHGWATRLRAAIADERFVLWAQPITPLCSNGVPRFELLLRMVAEDGELIPPGTFLYNAERFGLMGEIDEWVMAQGVTLLEAYHARGQDIALAINVSARTLDEGRVRDHLATLLDSHRVNDGRLVVEITETAAITNIERARDLARDVRSLGCALALDDFGAGFATFYYLKHLEFDYVKIDGEFIKRLPHNAADQLVVRAVVDIARGLGSETVAEFVQDDETIEMLRAFGVGYAQGYHTGRPGPLAKVLPQLAGSRLLRP